MSQEKFHKGLRGINDDIQKMGVHALDMLTDAVRAFKERDVRLAESVYARKERLDFLDRDIEERALRLLTLHQPMAGDLRTIATILKMDTYLNRIGRYGKAIAKDAIAMANKPHMAKLVLIPRQAKLVRGMIEDALRSFAEDDLSYIEDIAERDDEVDAIWDSVFRESITYMMEDAKAITPFTHYLMVARHLERCGDHACKIAEKVHYKVTGEHIEIK